MFTVYPKHQGLATVVGLLLFLASRGIAQTATSPPSPSQVQTFNGSEPSRSANAVGTPTGSTLAPNSDRMYYSISPGDTLEVTVFGAPDLSQKVRVTSSGEIYLPLVNYVHVGGLNIQEAQAAIENALRKGNFLTSPHVSVLVTEYASGVVVMGEVARPGIYPVTASKGLLFDILTEAGGPTATAGQVVTIVHQGDPKQQTVLLSQNPEKNMAADVPLHQGDTVMVSRAGTIYVVGEVLSPSAFIMERRSGYTALKALAMARGPTRLAKLSQSIIVRQTPEGVKQIPVPLDKIVQNKAPDMELRADDILMVPMNHAKSAAFQAVAMAQSLAVWGIVSHW